MALLPATLHVQLFIHGDLSFTARLKTNYYFFTSGIFHATMPGEAAPLPAFFIQKIPSYCGGLFQNY